MPRGRTAEDADRTPAVEPALWLEHVQFAHHGEPRCSDGWSTAYRPYALGLARQLHRDRQSFEDVDQVALEALVRALQRFDPERGIPFPAFATPVILGSVRRYYRDQGWTLRVPRQVHEVAAAEQESVGRLTASLGRAPTASEVADDLDIEVDQLHEVRIALQARRIVSLEATTPSGSTVAEELGRIDQRLNLVDDLLTLSAAVDRLDDPTQALLTRYFYDGQPQIPDRRGPGGQPDAGVPPDRRCRAPPPQHHGRCAPTGPATTAPSPRSHHPHRRLDTLRRAGGAVGEWREISSTAPTHARSAVPPRLSADRGSWAHFTMRAW